MMIRQATYEDIPAIAQIHVDTWRSTYRGIVPDEYLANLSYETREQNWQRFMDEAIATGTFTLVAENRVGQVIGFANAGLERTGHPIYKGELNAIYILADQQQQGIGKVLVQSVVKTLAQSEINSLLVWVLADNPAGRFYAALGGQKVDEKAIGIGGISLKEIAYGWSDTSSLVGRTGQDH